MKKINLSNKELNILAQQIRKKVFEICLKVKNGHIGASSGATELLTSLYFGGIADLIPNNENVQSEDKIVIRGHLGPLRYTIFSILNLINEKELSNYRQFGSKLHGHEDHLETPGIDISPCGSLGMVLSYGLGLAISKQNKKEGGKVFVFIGDGEEQEGNISEAARHTSVLNIKNLVVIIDKNKKQLSGPTSLYDNCNLAKLWKSYGWKVVSLKKGNHITSVKKGLSRAIKESENGPVVLIADTEKGLGLKNNSGHFSGYHTYSTCTDEVIINGIKKIDYFLNDKPDIFHKVKKELYVGIPFKKNDLRSEKDDRIIITSKTHSESNLNHSQSTYFTSLIENLESVRKLNNLHILTSDVVREDFVEKVGLRRSNFYNVGLREQHMISLAHGISIAEPDSIIINLTFDIFNYRCIDQIFSSAIGGGNMIIIGDYAGLTNSKNGKTHQSSLHPLGLVNIPNLSFFEPWSVAEFYSVLNWSINTKNNGIKYIRVHNGETTGNPETYGGEVDQYLVYKGHKEKHDLIIVSSGFSIGECIVAAEKLKEENDISASVLNVINPGFIKSNFFIKPENYNTPILSVYNGSQYMLSSQLSYLLATNNLRNKLTAIGFEIGTTGDLNSLLEFYGLNSKGIYLKALGCLTINN